MCLLCHLQRESRRFLKTAQIGVIPTLKSDKTSEI
jgi:hypothetical protein